MSRAAGVGGVGGFVAEALARAGVGRITLIDSDRVSVSNLNRQIVALSSTVGRLKTEVMKERIYDINPSINVNIFNVFYTRENQSACGDFPGCPVVNDLPANAEDMRFNPWSGKLPHTLGNSAHVPPLLTPRSPRTHTPQQEKSPQ